MVRWFSVLVFIYLTSFTIATAQDYWWESTLAESVDPCTMLQAVDLDFDGDNDIVTWAYYDPYMIYWWENNGDAEFTQHELGFTEDDSLGHQLLVVDLDVDGDLDMVTFRDQSAVVWLENTGDLTFEQHVALDSLQYRPTFHVTDFDIDGDPDILVSDRVSYQPDSPGFVMWLELTDAQQFVEHTLVEGVPYTCVGAADLDADGDADLIANYADVDSETGYSLGVFENDGANQFSPPINLAELYHRCWFVSAVDMDLDGDLDIVTPYLPDGTYWLENNGGLNFTEHNQPELDLGQSPGRVQDIDNDGDLDMFLGYRPPMMLINDGTGELEYEVYSVLTDDIDAFAADINDDGSNDIVRVATTSHELMWSYRSDIQQPYPDPTLANPVSNFGTYSEPNHLLPSGEFPSGSGRYYFWSGDFWVGAKLGEEHYVSHADYGSYEWQPTAAGGGSRPQVEHNLLGDGDFYYACEYDDFDPVEDHTPLGLRVEQIVHAFDGMNGPQNAHLVEQTLYNDSDVQLDSVYAGWKFDMDLASGPKGDPTEPHIDDMCSYQPERQLAYMWDDDYVLSQIDDTGEFGWIPGVAGIRLLDGPTETAAFQWWAWTDWPETDFEKYQYMAGIHPGSGGAYKAEPDSVFDYRVLITTGPFTLAPGESVELAMTYAIGYGLEGLGDTIDDMVELWLDVGETHAENAQPLRFSLQDPYPNPFNAATRISYTLQRPSHIELKVTDVLGRRVATLVDGMRSAGPHTSYLNGKDLASGIYFITLRSELDGSLTQKAVLIK